MSPVALLVRALRVVRGSRNSKGVSPVDLKRFKVESKEKVSPPLQGGNREP